MVGVVLQETKKLRVKRDDDRKASELNIVLKRVQNHEKISKNEIVVSAFHQVFD